MKQKDRKVNKYKIKTKEGMKKRKSLVQKVSCLWNSFQVHGRTCDEFHRQEQIIKLAIHGPNVSLNISSIYIIIYNNHFCELVKYMK